MGARHTPRGLWLQWPWLDLAVPALVLALWALLDAPTPPTNVRPTFYAATSAAAGIGLAAAAFVCTIFYQSSNGLLEKIRQSFGPLIRRNWVWILSSLLGAVVLPVLAMITEAVAPDVAIAMAAGSGLTFITSFTRVIYWFHRTLGVLDSPASDPVQASMRNVPHGD